MLEGVTWFRQSSVRIRRGGVEIHIDPWGIPEEGKADYILLTHPHYDNFSEDDIARVRGPHTTLVAPASMRKQLEDVDHLMKPGDMVHLDGIEILGVPAYNEGKKFHPPENEWLGYVFTVDGVTYYHSGDTDFLEAMNQIRCDVAFLPCHGHYTMGPEDTVRAAAACHARVVVPVHWGAHKARANAERVKELAKKQSSEGEVFILEQGMPS
ncbi:MAG: Zn-dependent hydrolase [Gemmatimonadetes bacterium]|nr:Zn-dependent hydrolase [Gemmatimonadota bacterium]